MSSTRRAFVTSAAAFSTIAFLSRPAEAAEFSYKLGFDEPTDHPMTTRATEAAAKIKQESGGRLEIGIFPNNQLGNDTNMLAQVRSGATEMVLLSDGILANVVPLAAIENVTFAFADYKQAFSAMDGPLGNAVRSAVAGINVYPFSKIWVSGFKQVTNSTRPLTTPAEFKGLKFRVPPSPMETALFKAVDAASVPINFAEAYTALQTHLVDGASLPIATVETSKFYEVQKYVTMTNHLFTGYSLIANGDAWQKLPKNLRDIAEKHLNAAALLERSDIQSLDSSVAGKLTGQGMQISKPDLAPFRAAVKNAGLYAQFKTQFGDQAWALLEAASGNLG